MSDDSKDMYNCEYKITGANVVPSAAALKSSKGMLIQEGLALSPSSTLQYDILSAF